MAEVRISAEPRTEFGKGGARRTRRAGLVPAVLYGHGSEPRHLALPAREFGHALKTSGGSNVLLELDLPGGAELALPRGIQRDPLAGTIEHVDLLLVRRGELVTVDIPVRLVGSAAPGTVIELENATISVISDATKIPAEIEVSIAGAEAGTHVSAGDVSLPEGVELATDAGTTIVLVQSLAAQAAAAEESLAPDAGAAAPADADGGDAAE